MNTILPEACHSLRVLNDSAARMAERYYQLLAQLRGSQFVAPQ